MVLVAVPGAVAVVGLQYYKQALDGGKTKLTSHMRDQYAESACRRGEFESR